jgi:hypothetical protein
LNNKKTALRVVQSYTSNFCGRFRLHTRRSIYKIPLISKVINTKIADVQIGDDCINVYFEQCKGNKKMWILQVFERIFT